MLRPKVQLNLHNAREYFCAHLRVGDYYSEGQEIEGEWLGAAAEALGLTGPVKEEAFLALCEGRNPQTGARLTQRLNSTRSENGRLVANRRIFHDFTISPPKSVSVVALCCDQRIVEIHDRAVRIAMSELELFAETRVRKAHQDSSRATRSIVAACFRHDSSRELDPHLHTHCVVFNATYDATERRWKALQTEGMYRAQKFAENLYFHELAKGLRSLGYAIENNARNFEIRNVPPRIIACFSKRHEQIEAEAQRQAAEGYDGDMGELRTRIAHEHRRRKMKNVTADQLRSFWRDQLTPEEWKAMSQLGQSGSAEKQTADVKAIVVWADLHVFERRAVVNDYELKSTALARGRGEDFDLDELIQAMDERGYVHQRENPHKLTSRELRRCESEVVSTAQGGMNTRFELCRDYRPDQSLSADQAQAARQILTSRDFITLFRGAAGTGKSHTLKAVHRVAVEMKNPVLVLAPQQQQVQDLAHDGLPAQTLAQLLTTRQLLAHTVVILDEAGQVGVREMHDLIQLIQSYRGRLILSGDTRQHGAVAAGDALRAIEKHIPKKRMATLRTIRRQNPALARSADEKRFIRAYRAAVKEAADGNIAASFDRLDDLGCIRELPDEPRRAAIAGEYLMALQRGERPLIVAQTWTEVHVANDAIRSALKDSGKLGDGVLISTFQPVDRSAAEKRDARFYEPGHAAFFIRRYGRQAKGDVCEIAGANDRGVIVVKDTRRSIVSYRYADRFAVVKRIELEVAPGDRLQLKANGRSVEGARLHNGELVTVTHVESTGALVVMDERGATKTLAPSQRLLVRGYAVTSYASQGKTADTVIVADAANRAATNRQQWYVGISRGRKRVVVLTPDKTALRANIQQNGEREPALRPEPKRKIVRLVEQMHQAVTKQRINRNAELTRQQEFARRRMEQQQTRGIRI